MSSGFTATDFGVVEENGVLVTGLGAPSTEDRDFYLTLQHKDKHSESDASFGWDKPYIEYCGQGWSWYGHIESFELFRDHVVVQMDSEAAARMQDDGHIEVRFDLGEEEFSKLRRALERTFKGVSYFAVKV